MTRREVGDIPEIEVNLDDLFITDVDRFIISDWFFKFKPLDYTCTVTLSGYVVTRLIKWALAYGFLDINGIYTIRDGQIRRSFDATKNKENIT